MPQSSAAGVWFSENNAERGWSGTKAQACSAEAPQAVMRKASLGEPVIDAQMATAIALQYLASQASSVEAQSPTHAGVIAPPGSHEASGSAGRLDPFTSNDQCTQLLHQSGCSPQVLDRAA